MIARDDEHPQARPEEAASLAFAEALPGALALPAAAGSVTTARPPVNEQSMPKDKSAKRLPATAASERQRIVVVLGMHRSGSSAITRGLQALGVDLGSNLMPPAEGNNDKGFFEDNDVVDLNERILARAGGAWHTLSAIEAGLLAGPAFSAERREAATLLNAKLRAGSVFGFKDPRLPILLPLWRCVFDDLGLEASYILTVRDPLASAASLERRDGMPIEKGAALWGRHMLAAMQQTEGARRIFCSYDRLLADPYKELFRIARFLGIDPSSREEALRVYSEEFLDLALRHHPFGGAELRRSGVAPASICDLYELLAALAARDSDVTPAENESLEKIGRLPGDEMAPLFALTDRLNEAVGSADARAASALAAASEANAARDIVQCAHDEACRQRDEALARIESVSAELNQLRASNAEEIGLLTEAKQAAEARIVELGKEIEARRQAETDARRAAEARMANLEAQIETMRSEAAAAADARTMAEAHERALQEDVRSARSDIEDLKHALEGAEAAAEDTLDRQRAEQLAAERAARRAANEITHLRGAVAAARAEAAAYRASTSWKLTAPLRAVVDSLSGRAHNTSAARRATSATPAAARAWRSTVASHIAKVERRPPPAGPSDIVAHGGALPNDQGRPWVAAIIHAFHAELLGPMLARLSGVADVRFYVTAPRDRLSEAEAALADVRAPWTLVRVDNRGRDVAPFLVALRIAISDGAPLVLKLHAKRSPHLANGADWREELLDALLAPGAPARALAAFSADPGLGLLAPAAHWLNVEAHLGGNATSLRGLLARAGIVDQTAAISGAGFAAGSMFYARPDVFSPLLDSGIETADFEPEAGQTDGTLAHAVERATGLLTAHAGLRAAAIEEPAGRLHAIGGGAYRFV